MPEELQQASTQRLEQIRTTIFTCRSVIKYNSVLNEEQKDELISDIDTCLHYLRTTFTNGTSKQTLLPQSQFKQAGRLISISTTEKADNDTHIYAALEELYRIYHAYIDTKQSNNIGTFVVRFDTVVCALNEVQRLLETSQDTSMRIAEDPLHRIRTFIADLYYMFMELVRTLSNVLKGNDVHIETEKIYSMQKKRIVQKELLNVHMDSGPLSDAFLEHQRLNEMKGTLSRRISDSRAFLIFMQENLERDFPKRNEILVHLSSVALLLEDLGCLLSSYEDAAELLLENGGGDKRCH